MSVPLRLFFAVEPDAPARRAAAGVRDALRGRPGGDAVRWVREASLHVTLRFLGRTPADAVGALIREVEGELDGEAAFEARLGAVEAFPSPRRARVWVLAVEPTEPLGRLAAAVSRGCERSGWPPEERPFRAHLTLGRLRRGERRGPDPAAEGTRPDAAFAVREVVLFESQPAAGGSRYTALSRLPLRAQPDVHDSPAPDPGAR